jgi:putative DNA primase/helicase
MTFEEIIALFPGGRLRNDREYDCCCPTHEDRRASLGIGRGDNGGVVVKCQAGCETEAVIAAVGMTLADLAPPRQMNGHVAAGNTVYVYHDEAGNALFEVVRTPDKHFWQRLPGASKGGIGETRRVLFELPMLLKTEPGATVFIVEGEKDCWRLWKLGLPATTNPGGAGKWRQDETDWLKEHLADREFVILPDNDAPGIKHADEIEGSLKHAGLAVRSLLLPGLPAKGDVSDWLTGGKTKEDLLAAIRPPPHPLDLRVMSGGQLEKAELPTPESLIPHLLYRGFSTLIAGDSKLGKSSLLLRAMLAATSGGWWLDQDRRPENRLPPARILYVNWEDPLFITRDRARKAMSPEKVPNDFLTMEAPYDFTLDQFLDWVHGAYERLRLDGLVIDPIAVAAEWKDEKDNSEVGLTFKKTQRLAAETQLGVLCSHHVTKKPGEFGLNIRGGGAIKANVIGYLVLEREKQLFKLGGINKLSGQWEVLLDRRESDWSWWIVENRTGHTRTPQQAAKEAALADLLHAVGEAPMTKCPALAVLLDIPERTCWRYLEELEAAGLLHRVPLPPDGGRPGVGWVRMPKGEDDESSVDW